MATFYKGFVYETGLSAGLMIEGVPPRGEMAAEQSEPVDVFARRYIDEVLLRARDRIRLNIWPS